jgi:CheY-like chemotaxis protein/HPt (histidine-containing phosphotransfer) domain-containing protein
MPRELYGDFIHIKQIGLNFLSNAAKYTEQGSITLRINGSRQWKAGGGAGDSSAPVFLLRIAVEDTGIGIKEEHIGMLFDTFTRVDLPAHRNIEGTGLGLAIAKELAELMSGKITVESQWGKGSVFTLEVPQSIRYDGPMGDYAAAGKVKREAPSFTASGGHILVVDDNKENLLVLSSLLRRTLLTVDTAASGEECLEAVKTKHYHAIFMDYMMSGMDGIETFRRLREENKNFALPVIALTADVRQKMKGLFLEEGFSACLTKPLMWRELEQCLREWLPAELIAGEAGGEVSENPPEKPEDFPPQNPPAFLITPDTSALKDGLARDLSAWGVVLDEGLRYLEVETGLSQYKRLAEYFTENYENARREAATLVDNKDWKNLSFSIHSLKSKAGAVGAADLRDTATHMEKYCVAGDGAYIEAAMPLLLLEWERACKGLEQFIARMDVLTGKAEKDARRTESSGDSSTADTETLLRYIRGHRFSEAEEALNRLLAAVCTSNAQRSAASGEVEKRKLKAVQEKIMTLDFEGAEKLLLGEY